VYLYDLKKKSSAFSRVSCDHSKYQLFPQTVLIDWSVFIDFRGVEIWDWRSEEKKILGNFYCLDENFGCVGTVQPEFYCALKISKSPPSVSLDVSQLDGPPHV
jgi:hypothetical protein